LPSIIKRINQAEADAAAIRREAAGEARERLAEAEAEAQKRVAAAREDGRAAVYAAEAEAEAEGEKTASGILRENAAKADALCEAAKANVPNAVAYILERVMQS